MKSSINPHDFVVAISRSHHSIYDPIEIGSALWIPAPELEVLLDEGLHSTSLHGLPLRTRSRVVKEKICRILGYPVPRSFKRTRPRFPGQLFDTYIQKSDNLQIWNDELAPTRRYAIIRVSSEDRIERVKVVTGDTLALLDTTGTLTQKYQARLDPGQEITELVTSADTTNLQLAMEERPAPSPEQFSPTDYPTVQSLLPIPTIYDRLRGLIGLKLVDTGFDQERNRGARLHRLLCKQLGYKTYKDDGRFPDIRNQLLEVKLQTSPTIDLGLVRPDSREPLDVPAIQGRQIRHCDVRYALFYAQINGPAVLLTHFYLTTGESFFTRFRQFQGKVLNKKLQIRLPRTFFDR